MSIMTRRDFMKTTAALGVGMAVFEVTVHGLAS